MEKLPLETQTLYAEFLERLTAAEAERSVGHLAGSFTTKIVKGGTYHYFQYSDPGGQLRQIYLGKESPALKRALAGFQKKRAETRLETKAFQRLAAQLRAGGALTSDGASARVLKALSDGGVFKLGGVLVGTHAFAVLGNLLGYRWEGAGLRTQDLDIAADPILPIAVPELASDVPKILESLAMGFLPVPPLHHSQPSTSFKVRGQALRVDLLTPGSLRQPKSWVPVPRWNAAAQALPYLDYLLEESLAGAVVDGGGILVNVPAPGRFALHKLITSQERAAAFQTKVEKDLRQAAQILQALAEERPGDVQLAWEALRERGRSWTGKAKKGLAAMRKYSGKSHSRIAALLK
ncbi:MAG TPA: GSU2403 family nucleotidyltransferase fold protein [bacterium]|nr:GSU2403 family nucleotidyltransferase fold protein [bacterium]